MELHLASNPLAHPIMAGTGGFRKARWTRGHRGKSAGVRVIYYYYVKGETIYLSGVYAKSEQENISNDEKNALRRLSLEIEAQG